MRSIKSRKSSWRTHGEGFRLWQLYATFQELALFPSASVLIKIWQDLEWVGSMCSSVVMRFIRFASLKPPTFWPNKRKWKEGESFSNCGFFFVFFWGCCNYFPRTPDETEMNSFVRVWESEARGRVWGRKNTGQTLKEKKEDRCRKRIRTAAPRAEISAALHLYSQSFKLNSVNYILFKLISFLKQTKRYWRLHCSLSQSCTEVIEKLLTKIFKSERHFKDSRTRRSAFRFCPTVIISPLLYLIKRCIFSQAERIKTG